MKELKQDESAYDKHFLLENKLVQEWYPERVVSWAHGTSMLELGLGFGYTVKCFARAFSRYTIVDGSQKIISRFRGQNPDFEGIRIVRDYFETYTPETRYDHISMGFILEHVEDPGGILDRYRDALAPGGTIFVAVPNCEGLHRRIGHLAGMLPDMTHLSPADVNFGHRRYYNVRTLRALIENHAYEILRMEGVFLKPLSTGQLESLDLPIAVYQALFEIGAEYPELSNGVLAEIRPRSVE